MQAARPLIATGNHTEVIGLTIHFRSQYTPAFEPRDLSGQQRPVTRPRKPITIEGQVQSVTRTQRPAGEDRLESSKDAYKPNAAQSAHHRAQLFEDNGLQAARSGASLFTRVAHYALEPTETRGVLIDTFA